LTESHVHHPKLHNIAVIKQCFYSILAHCLAHIAAAATATMTATTSADKARKPVKRKQIVFSDKKKVPVEELEVQYTKFGIYRYFSDD
jgi:hypothetical protein